MRHLTGWLFDVYADARGGASVWLIDPDGVAHHLHDGVTPFFFVAGTQSELHRVCEWLVKSPWQVELKRAERYDLFERRDVVVLQVNVHAAAMYRRVVRRVTETFPNLKFYEADLTIPQFYYFARDVFPLARCNVVVDEADSIVEMHVDDSPWALDYALPPLRVMTLALDGEKENPKNPAHGYRAPLVVGCDGREYVLSDRSPRVMLQALRSHLLRYDPDVVLSDYGDSYLLPHLLKLAREQCVELPFSRDKVMHTRARRAQSRFSYGRILYQPEAHWLYGRWHIDRQSGFLFDDYGLHGAIEIARLSQRAVQQSVRSSTGGAVSAIETAVAHKSGCLVPLVKEETEEFQTADELLRVDRGGLIYQPVAGVHFDVVELDFIAMYPSIMTRFNVSGETMNCTCCRDNYVPELKTRVCLKRHGLIPASIGPLVEKRFAYKRLKREVQDPVMRQIYAMRDSAAKWILVTCFGFAGHKHAKFGLITAHAAVCAYGREFILRAKEVVERFGYRVLHIITDSVWIQKPNASDAELDLLVKEIERVTNLPIALEARYKWVAFLNSRVDARRAVPNRYFAATRSGETKIRGIEARRHDTPAWIEKVQREMIAEMAEAGTRHEMAARLPKLMQTVTSELDRLRAGHVPLHELTVASSISRLPGQYRANTLNAAVARQLEQHGVELHLGERIRYVVMQNDAIADCDRAVPWDLTDGKDGYDVEHYEKLFLRAVETVMAPFGVNAAMLRDGITRALPVPAMQKQISAKQTPYWGPLFTLGRAN